MMPTPSRPATPPEIFDRLRAGQEPQAIELLQRLEARTAAQELALGDLLWRRGDLDAARGAWRRVRSGDEAVEALLRQVRVAGPEHVEDLLARSLRFREREPGSVHLRRATAHLCMRSGRLEEALELVRGTDDEPEVRSHLAALALGREPPAPALAMDLLDDRVTGPHAQALLLGICRAALRDNHLTLAGRAVRALGAGDDDDPDQAFWRALTQAREEDRVRALEELSGRSDLSDAVRRAGAARLAIAGRIASARRLAGDADPVLGVLLDYALYGHLPGAGSCDWARLRRGCASSPGLLQALCPGPQVDGEPAEEPVEYWASRGDLGRAREALRPALLREPREPEALRRMTLLAYLDHMSQTPAAPDPTAWEDLLGCGVVLACNPRLLGGWVGGRLRVYQARDELNARTVELAEGLKQRLWDAAAWLGDEECSVERRIALAMELQAAEAMGAHGQVPRQGLRLACGPSFARRFGLSGELRALFGETAFDDRERREHERHRLLRELGIEGARSEEDSRLGGLAGVRVWFSELGRAAAMQHLGDLEGAMAALEASYRRWSLPDPDRWAATEEGNLGFAELPDARHQLLQVTAEMICEVSVGRLERDMRGPDFNYTRCRSSFQGVFAIADSLGVDYEARYQVTRLVVGRYRALLERGDIVSLEQALALLEGATEAGIRNLARSHAVVANNAAAFYGEHGRLDLAVKSLEKAHALLPDEPTLLGNLMTVTADYAIQLAQQDVGGRARDLARRARELADEAHRSFPEHDFDATDELIQSLPVYLMVGAQAGDAAPPLEAEVRSILRGYASLRKAGELEPALQAAREARALAPAHPELQLVEVRAGIELTAAASLARAAVVHAEVGELLQEALAEHPVHQRLRAAQVAHRRTALLLDREGSLTLLLRRAFQAMRSGQMQPAIRLLEIGMVLHQSKDPRLCDLLAHCLVEAVGGPGGRLGSQARRSLARAQVLVDVGLRQDPLHPGLDATQRRIERLQAGQRSEDV